MKINFRRATRGLFHISSFLVSKLFYCNDSEDYNYESIIIFRPDNLGDFILSLPAISSVRESFPKAKITCVVNPESELIAKRVCDKVITYVSPFVHSKGLKDKVNFSYILNKITEIKQEKYDLIVDLRADLLTLLIAVLHRSRFRIDASSQRILPVFYKTLNILLRRNLFKTKSIHEMDFTCNLMEKLKVKVECDFDLRKIISSKDKSKVLEMIPRYLKKRPFAILHIGASWEGKRWDIKNFSEIADIIIDKYNLNVFFVGSKSELELSSIAIKLLKFKENVVNFTGKTNIIDVISLCSMANLAVCNDSAIGHIAAMSGVNTISLFGAQDPKNFAPKGKYVYILKKEIECSPCSQIKCIKSVGNRCMDLITVNDVISIIDNLDDQLKFKGRLL